MKREISIAFQTDKSAADYIALAKLVNEYDFDVVSVYCDLPYHPPYAPLMLMSPHITRARVGVAANSPSRIHPLDIAAQTALLAEVARGGVYVGLARGAWLSDHGITERQPSTQGIHEAVDIIRYILSGATGGYEGQVYQLAPHVRAQYPLPSHPVPILIGSWGRKLCALAGRVADEVKVGGSTNPDLVPIIQSYIRAGEESAGRQPGAVRVVMGAVSVLDEDRNLARRQARRAVALYLPVVAPLDPSLSIDPELIDRLRVHTERDEKDLAADLISDDILDRFAFAGNADDIINHVIRLFEAGAGRVEFGTPHGLHPQLGINLLGRKVIPALRQYLS